MRARRVTSHRPKVIIITAVATSMSVTAESRTSRRSRVSESMYRTSTHAAQTLTPFRSWTSVSQMERTLSASCGAYCRRSPSASSRCANVFIASRNDAEQRRVGSACGSKRAVDVIRNTSGNDPAPGASGRSSSLGSSAVVAAGSATAIPKRWAHTCLPSASAAATLDACAAHAAYKSAARHARRLLRAAPRRWLVHDGVPNRRRAQPSGGEGRADERQHAVDQKAGLALVCVDAPCVKAEEVRQRGRRARRRLRISRPTNSRTRASRNQEWRGELAVPLGRHARHALEGRVTGFEFLSLFGDRPPRVDLGVFRRRGRARRPRRAF